VDDTGDGLQLHMSRLLLGSLIISIAATLAVAVFGILAYSAPQPPGAIPPNGQSPSGLPPGGPTSLLISIAIFVAAWVSVVVAHARDQVLRKLTAVRADILAAIEECDGKRETEAYLRGMRSGGGGGDVRPLHLMPPPDVG
jgi:hypothetical protein